MPRLLRLAFFVVVSAYVAPSVALAQRFDFTRTIDASGPLKLDVSTSRGKIEVVGGAPGHIVVEGTATVRVGLNVPANAVDLARQVAAAPPIEQAGQVVRLHEPTDRAALRAVTVSYRVHVPPATEVKSVSESGETSIRGVSTSVDAHTQSATLDLADLAGTVRISTGSGAVKASAISGDVDVETASSAIDLRGVRGGLIVKTQSGRVTAQGTPLKDWTATTSSSSIGLELDKAQGFVLDASSRSGSVVLEGASVSGATTKRSANGTVGQGGPVVRLRTGSGAIRVQVVE